MATGAGVVVGVVVGAVVVVAPDPESVPPPADGAVTGLGAVGAGTGVGTGRGRGVGVLLDEPRGGMVTGDERTGMAGSADPLPESETRSALMTVAAEVADGTTTTSDERVAPEAYEVGWAVDAVVPLVHTELPAGVGAAEVGAVTAGAGGCVGTEPTGTGSAGAAISPDQAEAEYVRFGFGVTFFWATGDADAARAVPSPTATTPTVIPWVTRAWRTRRAPIF
ncbi:MAG TPA: hypothetical protein VHU17_11930 [Acidimicrobiales bacterium]|nr:hypothetical protein [Acidimicrobiales bacterium]